MSEAARQAFIGLGSNLGDRGATLRGALGRLRETLTVLAVSPVYETDPVGVTDQPVFFNLVIGVKTTLDPEALLRLLLDVEDDFGRVRVQRWGPRTLDLDLLAYEGEERSTSFLELPHPRMLERIFVTVPLGGIITRPCFAGGAWTGLREKLAALPPPNPPLQVADVPME